MAGPTSRRGAVEEHTSYCCYLQLVTEGDHIFVHVIAFTCNNTDKYKLEGSYLKQIMCSGSSLYLHIQTLVKEVLEYVTQFLSLLDFWLPISGN